MTEKNTKKHNTAWMIVLCVALVGCIGCVSYVGWYVWSGRNGEKEYENVKSEVKDTEEKVSLEEVLAAEFDGWTDGEAPELPEGAKTEEVNNPIDFEKLQQINPELYAWIEIPNTNIDYPVAQKQGDNSYYLYHDMYQEPQFAGCIYTEDSSEKDFSDVVTVMYGHNMRNGSMFRNLHLFEDPTFFEENQDVHIYIPGHKLSYRIFAAYEYDDRHIENSFDFQKKTEVEKYIEDIFKVHSMGDNIRPDVTVTAEDKILTLSTCVGGKPGARYLVQAVLQNDEKTK